MAEHDRPTVTRRSLLRFGAGLVASGSLASVVAACGGAAPAAQSPGVPFAPAPANAPAPKAVGQGQSAGPVSLAIAAGWTTTGWKAIWDLLLKAYQDRNPTVTISLDQSSATGQYDQRLSAELAAGALPDVIYTADNYAASFKQNKITQDMLPFARTTNFPIDDFNKSFLDLGMVDGTLHMLPASGDVVVLFFNKRLVQEAGVTIPWTLDPATSQWTYADFVSVCQRLTVDANGKRGNEPGFDKTSVRVYGAAIDPTWWAIYVPAILGQGGQIVTDDLSRARFDSKESIAAIDALTKPVLDGYWAPLSFINANGNSFSAGTAAVIDSVRGGIPTFRTAMKDDWDVAHFFRWPAKRVTGMGSLGFALSGSTKQPDAAWSFLSYMYSEDGMKIIASQYGAVPVQQRFYQATWWKNLPPPPANNGVFTQAFDYGTLPPRLPFYSTGPFTKAIADGFSSIELKLNTPQQVAANVNVELQKVLDQAKKG
jgi:multiple sugar transport system substrate-binding protein